MVFTMELFAEWALEKSDNFQHAAATNAEKALREQIRQEITEEAKADFDKFLDLQALRLAERDKEVFITDFKMGMRFLLEGTEKDFSFDL